MIKESYFNQRKKIVKENKNEFKCLKKKMIIFNWRCKKKNKYIKMIVIKFSISKKCSNHNILGINKLKKFINFIIWKRKNN